MSEQVRRVWISTRAHDRATGEWLTVKGEVVPTDDYTTLEADRDELQRRLDAADEWATMASEQLKKRDAALAELAALKGGQEPVAEVSAETFSSDGTSDIITCNLPIGTKLYTAAPVRSGAAVAVWDDMTKRAIACTNQPIPHGADLYLAPPAQASAWVPEALRKAIYIASESGPQFKLTLGFESLADMQSARSMLAAAPTPGASDVKGGAN